MKKNFYLVGIILLAAACGAPLSEIEQKKNELKGYQTQLSELTGKIDVLEVEIANLDPDFAAENDRSILVTTLTIKEQPFEHKIEVRGQVESRKNVLISAEIPGKIQSIAVTEGQSVKKGQVLLSLDADIIRNNIAEIKTNLELAADVYTRQVRLRAKNIGTEMQYLEAKNKKESLERKLATAYSQLDQAVIRAPFNGSVDMVSAREGELAQPGSPLVRIVNPFDVYIKADVSERHLGTFKPGDVVEVYIPTFEKTLKSKIVSIGQVLNANNRTFEVEIALPRLKEPVRPNQVAVIRLSDYKSKSALLVPTNLIQKDNIGTFLFGMDVETMTAKKLHIQTGVSYDNKIEILEGLYVEDLIINKGFREMVDGIAVKLENEVSLEVAQNN